MDERITLLRVAGETAQELEDYAIKQKDTFVDIWRYRIVLKSLVRRNMTGRFKNTVLGYMWNVLLPLLTIFVYCLVFTTIRAKSMDAYWLYICSGMFPMMFITGCMSGRSINNCRMYIKKMHFPVEIAVIADALTNLITFLISYTLVIIMAISFDQISNGGHVDFVSVAMLPIYMVLLLVFGIGLSKLMSTVMVMNRDLGMTVSALSKLLMWVTPTIFVLEEANDLLHTMAMYNPFTYFINAFHNTLYYCNFNLYNLGLIVCLSFGVWGIGTIVFNRYKRLFVEVV